MSKLSKGAIAALLAATLGGCTSAPAHGTMHAANMQGPAMMGPGGPGMETHMRQMQEMHSRMMAATTPEQRQALRAEHQRAMHGGMAAMQEQMGAMQRSGQCSPEMMQRQRNMMQMMMQMMEETPADGKAPKK